MNGACSSGDTSDAVAVKEAMNALSAALIKSSNEIVPDISFEMPWSGKDKHLCTMLFKYSHVMNTYHPEVSPDDDLSIHLQSNKTMQLGDFTCMHAYIQILIFFLQ